MIFSHGTESSIPPVWAKNDRFSQIVPSSVLMASQNLQHYLALVCCRNKNWAVYTRNSYSSLEDIFIALLLHWQLEAILFVLLAERHVSLFPSIFILKIYNPSVIKLAWPQGLCNIPTHSFYSINYTHILNFSHISDFSKSHSKLAMNSLMSYSMFSPRH